VQAKALLKEALRLVPRYPLALIYLADLETRQGNYREAEGYYSKVSAYSGWRCDVGSIALSFAVWRG
jgi:Tfp pilus assembly protein PilF